MNAHPRWSLLALLEVFVFPGVFLLTGCPAPETVVPPSVQAPETKIEGVQYTVAPDDTLYSIARRHGVDWRDIVDANPSVDWRTLSPGQVIVIPHAGAAVPPPGPRQVERVPRNPGHSEPLSAESAYVWPLRGEILSRFRGPTAWRMGELNQGIDIRATASEVVVAAKSGRVNTFSPLFGFGKVVVLEHDDGTATFYGHLEDILCTHGTWVKQGEPIGVAGSSGRSSGTELHFRIFQNQRFVDPLPLMPR